MIPLLPLCCDHGISVRILPFTTNALSLPLVRREFDDSENHLDMLPAEVQVPPSGARVYSVDAVLCSATAFASTRCVGSLTGDVVIAHGFPGPA
jgi:hypothetical protein